MCKKANNNWSRLSLAERIDEPSSELLRTLKRIQLAARETDDGQRCTVAPHPDLREKIKRELQAIRANAGSTISALVHALEPDRPGFNDGLIIPPDNFPLGTPMSVIRSAAADRAPLRGVLRVIVVLVDFSDKQMAQTQQHYKDLFFSTGVIPTKSVREYYQEVTQGLIDIQGDVVGPFRLPQTLAAYAHGASGLGGILPNAQTMARDALIASDPQVNFAPYDNDGNGFVDAFIVIHAGPGAEQTGASGDIWSHKWTLDGGVRSVDGTKVFGYLTVPEDCRIGVCCHELGHLLFGFPDLYDTDYSSEGIGNWCLMSGGSWGGVTPGETPVHPSAWCKANQGWVSIDVRTTNGMLSIPDVKDPTRTVHRLWKDGTPGNEYFLIENRQKAGFDVSLPGPGLLIWHIDESIAGNTDENHPKVALMQADAKRDMELNHNRGDAGDPFPGSSNNNAFNANSNPNSKSYSGATTCVAVTGISPSGPVMTANVQVKCKVKEIKEKEVLKEQKDLHKEIKEKELAKEHKDIHKEIKEKEVKETKEKDLIDGKIHHLDKHIEKPITDKGSGRDKITDGKFAEGKLGEGGGLHGGTGGSGQLEARVAALETLLRDLIGASQSAGSAQPFIGSELRPDLSQGALAAEEDFSAIHQQMQLGSAQAKRHYDTKHTER